MKKKNNRINIIRSETWLGDDFQTVVDILEKTVEDFSGDNERIINIEAKKGDNGLSRFWIYTEEV